MNNFQENINQILILKKRIWRWEKKYSKTRELEEETSSKQKCSYISNHDLADTNGYLCSNNNGNTSIFI